ncbi:MAG: 3-dehydroquinate synthase [bacterium]|nr:3-dehydroquinate synthase [bacterium]
MKTIEIRGQSGKSTIAVNESLKNLETYIPANRRTVIITDRNVNRLYRRYFPDTDVIGIGTGEEIKTLDTVKYIYQRMLELEMDRSCFVVGIGGGVVCDIAGYAASTYMRGLPFGFVSSSLLSQVDAGVGGKNGVNFQGYKNIIGVFNQPSFVICDLEMFKTLPPDEYINGFAEVVKHGAIADEPMFAFLEERRGDALNMDPEVMERLVTDSVIIKAGIVEKDETEKGERRKLNFGHTLAHALEKSLGVAHGEAVSAGMVFAARFSVHRNRLKQTEADRLKALLEQLGLPVRLEVPKEKLREAIKKDKKKEGQGIHFVFLNAIGDVDVEEIPIAELEAGIDDLY